MLEISNVATLKSRMNRKKKKHFFCLNKYNTIFLVRVLRSCMIASNFHYGNYLLLFFLRLNCHTFIGLCMTYDVYLFPSGDIRQYGQRFACSSWHFNKRLKLNSNNIYHCKWTKMQQRISKSLWNVRMIIKKIWFCIIGQDVKLFFFLDPLFYYRYTWWRL